MTITSRSLIPASAMVVVASSATSFGGNPYLMTTLFCAILTALAESLTRSLRERETENRQSALERLKGLGETDERVARFHEAIEREAPSHLERRVAPRRNLEARGASLRTAKSQRPRGLLGCLHP